MQEFLCANIGEIKLSELTRQYQVFRDMLHGQLDLDTHLLSRFQAIQTYYKFRQGLRFLVNNSEFNILQMRSEDQLYNQIRAIYLQNSPSFQANVVSQQEIESDFQQYSDLKHTL